MARRKTGAETKWPVRLSDFSGLTFAQLCVKTKLLATAAMSGPEHIHAMHSEYRIVRCFIQQ